MTVERERRLRTAQRKMLRRMVNVGRKTSPVEHRDVSDSSSTESEDLDSSWDAEETLEPWIDWLKRATVISEDLARTHGVRDWVDEQRCRKWRLAGHTARRSDNRWSTKLIEATMPWGYRAPGHPCRRWDDELQKFIMEFWNEKSDWKDIAQLREVWKALELDFINKVGL